MPVVVRGFPKVFVGILLGCLLWNCSVEPEGKGPATDPLAAGPERTPVAENLWAHPEIKAELLLDRSVVRDPSDGGGTARLLDVPRDGPKPVPASSRQSFTIEYTAGALGIVPGGTIFFQVSPFWGWELPQTGTDQRGGFLRAHTAAEGVDLVTKLLGQGLVAIEVQGSGLRQGDTVEIEFGAGPAGTRVDRFAETGERLWLAVDGNADGIRKLIDESPTVDIMAREATRLHVSLPGSAASGATVPLTVALLDRAGNSGMPWRGSIDLALEGSETGMKVPASIALEARDGGRKTIELVVTRPGVYRVSAVARPTGAAEPGPAAQSNPLVAKSSPTETLLWGDLQVHTQLSDGSGSTLENLLYARDAAGLDVVALTDHDHWGLKALDDFPEVWQEQLGEVQAFHEPGRFVTIPAFEWTNWVEGHRHVLFFGQDDPLLLSSLDERYDTPPELWAALAGKNAMTIAHHSAGGPVPTDWSIPPDPDLEPLTEIVSVQARADWPGSGSRGSTLAPVRRSPRPCDHVRSTRPAVHAFIFRSTSMACRWAAFWMHPKKAKPRGPRSFRGRLPRKPLSSAWILFGEMSRAFRFVWPAKGIWPAAWKYPFSDRGIGSIFEWSSEMRARLGRARFSSSMHKSLQGSPEQRRQRLPDQGKGSASSLFSRSAS
jgi:hypothetical protein